jgi:hypothetical protein
VLTRDIFDRDRGAPRIEALRASGVPARDIRLLTGTRLRDVRREPVGGFAGPVAPNAPVGTFGDRQTLRRQGAGGFAGDPDHERQAPSSNGTRARPERGRRDVRPAADDHI